MGKILLHVSIKDIQFSKIRSIFSKFVCGGVPRLLNEKQTIDNVERQGRGSLMCYKHRSLKTSSLLCTFSLIMDQEMISPSVFIILVDS